VPEKNINEVTRQARDLYDKGMTTLDRGSIDASIHFFAEAVSLEPAFLKARQALRLAQIKKYKTGGTFSKVFGSVSGSTSLASAFSNVKKNPTKAMEAAEKVLTTNPYNVQALKLLAEAAESMDLLNTAIFSYETAREGSPKNLNVILALGQLYQHAKMSQKAHECFEQAYKIDPTNSEAYAGMKDATANEAMTKGKWEEAGSYRDMIANIDEATSLEQANKIFKDEDIIRTQIKDVYKLTEEQPQNVSNWKKLGDLSKQVNEFDYAIQCYEHAFGLTNGADGTIENLISETKIKKVTFLISQKEEQLQKDSTNENLRNEVEQLKAQREATILEESEGKARRYPNDMEIRFELAQVYFRNKQVDKALKEFQVASSNPKNKIACTNWLGRCFREKGMLDMAVQRFKSAAEQAIMMDGLKKDILYSLGTTYEQMGKRVEAIEQFKIIYDVDVDFKDVSEKIENFYREQSNSPSS
jgi:tetratricopeptide (TPR) repeat protein